jgi:hypothetical protein
LGTPVHASSPVVSNRAVPISLMVISSISH